MLIDELQSKLCSTHSWQMLMHAQHIRIFLFKKHWIKKLKDQRTAGCVLRRSPTLSRSIDELSSVSELSSGENEPGPLLMNHNIRTSEVCTW